MRGNTDGSTCCARVQRPVLRHGGKDQKWNTSLCHPWASAPVPILIEEIAGVHIDAAEKDGYYWTPHIPEKIREFWLCVPVKGKKIIVEKKMGEVYAVIREDKE